MTAGRPLEPLPTLEESLEIHGSLECRQKAVAYRLDLAATEPGELLAYPGVVLGKKQVAPAAISQMPRLVRFCVDDVCEHHGQQGARQLRGERKPIIAS